MTVVCGAIGHVAIVDVLWAQSRLYVTRDRFLVVDGCGKRTRDVAAPSLALRNSGMSAWGCGRDPSTAVELRSAQLTPRSG